MPKKKRSSLAGLHLKLFSKIILFLSIICILPSCESKKGEVELAEARKLSSTKPSLAIDEYRKIVQVYAQESVAMKAATEASALCLKEKSCAESEEYFLNYIIKKSDNEQEQIAAQRRLSEIYYDKGFYSQAIEEMNRLLSKKNFTEGRAELKIKLAKSNFYIKNFYQAEVELNSYLKETTSDQEKFEGYLLKADIQSANKKYQEAMGTYKEIKDTFKDLYFKNQVYMNEVLLLEEQKLMDQAVSLLESIKEEAKISHAPGAEFLESKIERLRERKALMPGASGLKR